MYRTAITALKQTLKAKLPIINQPIDINDFIKNCNNNNKFICHLENEDRKNLFSFKKDIKNILMLVFLLVLKEILF